jgi:hypothetical protein
MAQEYCPGINSDLPHLEFVRQGMLYLEHHGLVYPQSPDSPSALATSHLLPKEAMDSPK